MKLTSIILSNDDPNVIRILVLTGIAWLPLMVLTLIDGTFYTSEITIPFIKDVTPFVRGLIVIPLLVMADNLIEPMMARVLKYLKISGVVADSEKERLSSTGRHRSTHPENHRKSRSGIRCSHAHLSCPR